MQIQAEAIRSPGALYPEDEKARHEGTSLSSLHAGDALARTSLGRRKTVLDRKCLRLLGPGTSLFELSAGVPAREVFSSWMKMFKNMQNMYFFFYRRSFDGCRENSPKMFRPYSKFE